MKNQKAFTLLEILLVIAAIGILAAIVIVAINPQRQLAQVRDTERRSSVNTVYQALEQYLISEGEYPGQITTSYQEVCNTGSESVAEGVTDCTGYVDLRVLVPTYLAAIPNDAASEDPGTGYEVSINTVNGAVSVQSVFNELADSIGVNTPSREYLADIYGNASAIYATFQVRSDQEFAMRVSNAGEQEQDIGFDQDGWIDRDALLDFAQGGTLTVRTWYDASGNGVHANQPTKVHQPVIVINGTIQENPTGVPALWFNGANRSIRTGVLSNQVNTPFSVVSVSTPNQTNQSDLGRYRVWSRAAGNSTRGALAYNSNQIWMHSNGGDTFVTAPISALDTHLVTTIYDTSSWALYLNQTLVSQGTGTISSADTIPIAIGSQPHDPSSRAYHGHIAFLLITDESLNDSREPIENYLVEQYNL